MDSHRNFSPDEPDGQAHQSERDYPDPEWDRTGGDPRYAPAPQPPPASPATPGDPGYGPPQAYAAPGQQYGDNAAQYGANPPQYGANPAYRDFPVPAEPRTGYPPFGGQSPYAEPAEAGGPWPADSAAVLAMPIGPRSGEPLPPPPLPPAFVAEPAAPAFPSGPGAPASAPPGFAWTSPTSASAPPGFTPGAQAAPGTVHTAPTSGLPHQAVDGGSQAGRPPLAGDPRPVSSGQAPAGAEETQVVRHSAESIDRTALRRPQGGPGQLGDGVYRSRHPGMAVAIVAVTVLFELMALRLLASAFFTSKIQVGGSIASSFLVLGLPMFGFGLYGLLSGAAAAPGAGLRVWLRPPLVFLPVALVLFVTAGLAAA